MGLAGAWFYLSLITFLQLIHLLASTSRSVNDDTTTLAVSEWCAFDSGRASVTGSDATAYVSVTRDGSVWLRLGDASFDWELIDVRLPRVQTPIFSDEMLRLLTSTAATDYCILTDFDLRLTVQGAWHPSYLTFYDPSLADTRIVSLRVPKMRDCRVNTTLSNTTMSLSADKQGLVCDGGKRNSCGSRHAPLRGHASPTWFLLYVSLDLYGHDNWYCDKTAANDGDDVDGKPATRPHNAFTFVGSYYYVYAKVATCRAPTDSQYLGNEIRLRPLRDETNNTVIIADPLQTALADGIIDAWQMYSTAVSLYHAVYLQVWRPTLSAGSVHDDASYMLVGQTFVRLTELRFHEILLPPSSRIHVARGDVLGLYYPGSNPIGWSTVPCASAPQRHLFISRSSREPLSVGSTHRFKTAPAGHNACRQYSFAALFANKSEAKRVDDWRCPSGWTSPAGSRRRDGGADLKARAIDPAAGLQLHAEVDLASEATTVRQRSLAVNNDDSGNFQTINTTTDNTRRVHVILLVCAGLFLTMIAVGVLSYYRALYS